VYQKNFGEINRQEADKTRVATEEFVNTRRIVRTGLCMAIITGCSAVAQTKPATSTQTSAATPGSPAAKVGLFVYPQKEQTPEQQAKDESACYSSAQQQTGIDPAAPPPPPQQAQQQKGGAVKGAAKGAAGGAAIGAIADDAGTGAAAGATAGAVRGRRQQKKANKQAEQQAQEQAQTQQQQRLDTFRRAFSACMDSKAYSVK
jgi:Glycine-zipper domain